MSCQELEIFKNGVMILFQIDLALKPSLPEFGRIDKFDSNHGISDEYVKMVVQIS